MQETKQNWEEEFYKQFTDECDAENGYYDSQFTCGRPNEVESFIHKVRTEAILEERKRIEEKLLERRSWIMDTYNYEEAYDAEKAQVRTIDEILQIINNKNI